VQREILLWTIGNTKFYATEVGYDLYIHKYCTDWLCLAAEKCKFVTCKWWTYVMLPADSFHAFFNTVIFIFIVFDRGHIVCVKYVNQMLILYLYADKLEPSVIPEVELCSLNILTVSGADNYTLCQCPLQIWTLGTEVTCPQPDLDYRDWNSCLLRSWQVYDRDWQRRGQRELRQWQSISIFEEVDNFVKSKFRHRFIQTTVILAVWHHWFIYWPCADGI